MSTVIDSDVGGILESLLTAGESPMVIVAPSASTIAAYIDVASELGRVPAVQLLAEEETLSEVMEDFLIASRAADLVAAESLVIHEGEVAAGTGLVVSEQQVAAIVPAGGQVAALTTDEAGFVNDAFEHYAKLFQGASEYSLRTPPLSRVRETLGAAMGPDAVEDFNAVLESLTTARGDGEGLDEVTISLLVAAKNEELLYDISKWGEDVGIASKATFSRAKTELEEMGLIDTEKVPIDVGRPRLRLRFAHERFQAASADELASVAQSLLG